MNKKQAVYILSVISLVIGGYAYVFFWVDGNIPFWKAYLIAIGILLLSIGIVVLLIGAVKLYEKLEDKKEAL